MAAKDHENLKSIAEQLASTIRRAKDKADTFPDMASQLWTLDDSVKALVGFTGDSKLIPDMIAKAEPELRKIIKRRITPGAGEDKKMQRRREAWFSWQCLLALSDHALQGTSVETRETREVNAKRRVMLVVNKIVDYLVPAFGARAFLLYHWLASEGNLLTSVTQPNEYDKDKISQMTADEISGLFDNPAHALSPPTGTPYTLFPPQFLIDAVPKHPQCNNEQVWFNSVCERLWMPNVGKCTYKGAQDKKYRCAFKIDEILKLVPKIGLEHQSNLSGESLESLRQRPAELDPQPVPAAEAQPAVPIGIPPASTSAVPAHADSYHGGSTPADDYCRPVVGAGTPLSDMIGDGSIGTGQQDPHNATTREAVHDSGRTAGATSATSVATTPHVRWLFTATSAERDG